MDTLTKERRSWTMSRIRSKDTKPELLVRKYLFSRGLRFRVNVSRIPGHPDIVPRPRPQGWKARTGRAVQGLEGRSGVKKAIASSGVEHSA